MTRFFEGRTLHRPDDDVEDQGLAFDLGTIENRLSRRKLLGMLGVGAGSAALAACSSGTSNASSAASSTASSTSSGAATTTAAAASSLTEMKTETAGPYPGDGSNGPDVLEKVGVERRDIRGSIGGGATASGVPLTLKMNIIDMVDNNAPMAGAAVYVWHCDAAGKYSMYSTGLEDETYLRGVQVTGDDGSVEFTTIVPGCYEGRWPHIHFEVFSSVDDIADASKAILTSQIAVPEEVDTAVYATDNYADSVSPFSHITLANGNVFSDGWDQQLPSFTGAVQAGYSFTIDVPIDTTTPNSGGGAAPAGRAARVAQAVRPRPACRSRRQVTSAYSPSAFEDSHRQIAAAVARFNDSADPLIGMVTRASHAPSTSSSSPCASLPNSHAVGRPSNSPGTASEVSPSMAVASVDKPAARSSPSTRRTSRSRATGIWKSDPAVERTTFGDSGSTVSPAKITASAPTASAMRMIVPALPGSAVSTQTATNFGLPFRMAPTDHSTGLHTAKMPVCVTVSASASAAFSVIAWV